MAALTFQLQNTATGTGARAGVMQTDHGEMPIAKSQRRVPRRRKTKETVCPMVNTEDFFFVKGTHSDFLYI
jgi:hypothetical protein